MSKQKLIVAYACLVGIPLTGLLGILRAGQRLAAPASVGGAWFLNSNFDMGPNDSCRRLLQSVKEPFMSISQSGNNLVFSLNNAQKTVLPGTLQGTTLTMSSGIAQPSGTAEACSNPQAIRVQAALEKQAGRRVLAGALSVDGCQDCAPVQFRATPQSSHGKEGL